GHGFACGARQQLRRDSRTLQPALEARGRGRRQGTRRLLAEERRAAVRFRPDADRATPDPEARRGRGDRGGIVAVNADTDRGVRAVVEVLARALTDRPDEVRVVESAHKSTTLVELYVAPGDLGKVIGKQGR